MKARTIYRCSLSVLAVLTAANGALALWVWKRLDSPVQFNVRVIEPQSFAPPTNVVETVSVRKGLLPENVSIKTLPSEMTPRVERWSMPYHYCVVNGRPLAFLNGVYVREGDRHAYGVVDMIYPERIYFAGGNYIDNSQTGKGVFNDANSRAVASDTP